MHRFRAGLDRLAWLALGGLAAGGIVLIVLSKTCWIADVSCRLNRPCVDRGCDISYVRVTIGVTLILLAVIGTIINLMRASRRLHREIVGSA